ncbi:M50 family metallopeptidase [Lacipirellula sp.]|uniref:M50 family metallopeptidase n=1 Tax=Lacipirellula sp. TaxID=2691419 RepID=UPI003D139355
MTSAIILRRAFFSLVVVYLAWLAMQAVHEAGHVVAAWLTRGTVTSVELPLLGISRTDVRPNPRPLAVAWAGPIVGAIIPLLLMLLVRQRIRISGDAAATARTRRRLLSGLTEFFAGFCLIANGAYISIGSFERIGDAGDLLRHGSPQWLLVVFGVVAVLAGLLVWHFALESYRQQPRVNDPPERNSSGSP